MPLDNPTVAQGSTDVPASGAPVHPTVSCLITTYVRERAEHLAEALESIFAQDVPPDQLVLVLDGPVGASQEEVIARYRRDRRIAQVDVVRLPENLGLASALNVGLWHCTGEWVMRMDSDDLCRRDRLRLQLDHILAHPRTDHVSSWTEEFASGQEATRLKASPVEHDAVVQALRWRNIIAHCSVLMRAEMVRRVGGYSTAYPLLEDYDLWTRLAQAGARFHVIPAVLTRVRSGLQQSARRGGWRYCLHEIRFRTSRFRSGFLNSRQFVVTTSLYVAFRLAGKVLRGRLYRLTRA